jgi:hypothetical protein
MSQVPLLIEEAVGCPSSPIGTVGHFGTFELPPPSATERAAVGFSIL